MSMVLLGTIVLSLVFAVLINWRLRTGWALGGALAVGVVGFTFGGAGLIAEMTNGRASPQETAPWVSLVAILLAAVIARRHAARRDASPIERRARPRHRDEDESPFRPSATETARPKSLTLFLSYRRSDSQDVSGRIYDRLIDHFGANHVFKDVDSIPLGVDFRKFVGDKVARCDALLAVIGPQWLETRNEAGGRRLDDARDLVRAEVAAALARDIPVVPVLVGSAAMPDEAVLPEELRELAYRNAIPVRPDPDFHKDVSRLIEGLEAHRD